MYTEVYADVLFLVNFSMDVISLYVTARLCASKISAKRLALGGIIVLGIVVLVVVLVVSYVNKNNVPQLTFENTKILELQEKPRLQMPQ